MIGDASRVIARSAWPLIPPGVAISLTCSPSAPSGTRCAIWAADEPVPTARRAPRRRARPATGDGAGEARTTTPTALLEVRDLSVAVTDPSAPTVLVSEVSFTVEQGETLALVGESGCGKTLTALAVLGLLPPGVHASAGYVRFGDARLAS